MAAGAGPDIVTNGLVLAFDPANIRSFPGEPTTNIVPSPENNSRFTTSNSWATYNTAQYNGATYFSIGTISSVSSNQVTLSSVGRTLYTYDVLTPQTTGGGVTAGTNYMVKKTGDTTFTLHAYNSSQDGSQGYIDPATGAFKVHESVALDQRVSINSTNFPTMWWGPPHVPNMCYVKQVVSSGGPNNNSSFMRIHLTRPAGTDGGMAYGVYPSVTQGDTITVSFWARSSINSSWGWSTYFGGGYAAPGFDISTTTEWQRFYYTWTASNTFGFYLYFWPGNPGSVPYYVDLADIQVELGRSYPTNFVIGTRGTTAATGGGLRDRSGKGNNGELINGPTSPIAYTKGVLAFDGTNDYVTIPTFTSAPSTQITCETWIKPLRGSVGTGTIRGGAISNTNSTYIGIIDSTDGGSTYSMHWANQTTDSRLYNWNGSIPDSAWSHLTGTYDGSTTRAYLNGVEIWSASQTGTIPAGTYVVGTYGGNLTDGVHNFNGLIGDARIYNRALTASEVLENYNKSKGKYKTL